MTKFVVSGYIGFDNFGDEAIAKVLSTHLKTLDAEKITLLSSNPQKTAELYDVHSEHFLKFFKSILESDVLISGGGSLLQDITSLKSLIYYLVVITTALILNKKVIIFAQGFTPFRTRIGRFFTKFVLQYCNNIYVRDQKSQEILNQMNIKSELVSDPVFGIETPLVQNKEGVGVQLRNYHTLSDDFLNNLADAISKNFPNQKIKLFSLQDSIDLAIINKFAQMLQEKNIETLIYKNLTIEKTIEEISKLEYLIGMRFHANLIATKAKVKVLGINYDIKVLNLATHIGFPIIGLNEKSFDKEFEDFIQLDTTKYNIPNFEFPEI